MSTTFKFEVTVSNQADADTLLKALKNIGLSPEIDDELISLDSAISELFPEKTSDEIAGIMLRNSRNEKKLTQAKLAEMLGTSRTAITEMETGKRPISKTTAKKLGNIFDTAYTVFL